MGGDLRVASEPGKGSTFSFNLRMRASAESDFSTSARMLQQADFQPAAPPTSVKSLQGRVLLAEDNAVNQAVAAGMLSAIGVEAAIACNGEAVVQLAARETFDAILMDCQMPVLDGYQATRTIREMEIDVGRTPVPIIAVTANALPGDKEKCLSAGMNDYLSKPYTSEQLARVLGKYLSAGDKNSTPNAGKLVAENIHTPPSQPDNPIIDPKVLDQLLNLQKSGTPDLVQRVMQTYIDSSDDLVATLYQAMENADPDCICRTAHALKSASANVGALNLAKLCKKIETAGRAQDLESASELWQQFQPEYERVIQALRNWNEAAAA
jgi:CheY-like chemotaxis protein